jgi:hypothetical protein
VQVAVGKVIKNLESPTDRAAKGLPFPAGALRHYFCKPNIVQEDFQG